MDWKSTLQPLVRGRVAEHMPLIVNLVLILALAQSFAKITWMAIPKPHLEQDLALISGNKTNPAHPVNQQVIKQSISQWHLFGEVKIQQPTVEEPQPVVMPETPLNLTLRGVVSSKADEVASAIIADASGHEDFYIIGSQVPGGAVLEEIYSDRVILRRNNRLETLKLPQEADAENSTGFQSRTNYRQPRVLPGSGSSRDTGALLHQYREALINDPQSVMDLVRAYPVRENGKLIGYKVRPGRDRQLLQKFGLRSGDVVTAVNGVPLDNPLKGLEIMRDLTTATQVSLDIKRGGVSQTLISNDT